LKANFNKRDLILEKGSIYCRNEICSKGENKSILKKSWEEQSNFFIENSEKHPFSHKHNFGLGFIE